MCCDSNESYSAVLSCGRVNWVKTGSRLGPDWDRWCFIFYDELAPYLIFFFYFDFFRSADGKRTSRIARTTVSRTYFQNSV